MIDCHIAASISWPEKSIFQHADNLEYLSDDDKKELFLFYGQEGTFFTSIWDKTFHLYQKYHIFIEKQRLGAMLNLVKSIRMAPYLAFYGW